MDQHNKNHRILVLGATGMLGSTLFRYFQESNHQCWGTVRSEGSKRYFPGYQEQLFSGIDVLNETDLMSALEKVKPTLLINCVGVIKQHSSAVNPLVSIPINALLPHRLASFCNLIGSRLIHISTDCVFSGKKGNYSESDLTDAEDLYGKSKELGEVREQQNTLTIRTSLIGHELASDYSLVDWYLSQSETVAGFTRAIFSGFPTIEMARIIDAIVIPEPKLNGLYHVSARPISKFDLLTLIHERYQSGPKIRPDEKVQIDRSLDSSRFRKETGYRPPEWEAMIDMMFRSRSVPGNSNVRK